MVPLVDFPKAVVWPILRVKQFLLMLLARVSMEALAVLSVVLLSVVAQVALRMVVSVAVLSVVLLLLVALLAVLMAVAFELLALPSLGLLLMLVRSAAAKCLGFFFGWLGLGRCWGHADRHIVCFSLAASYGVARLPAKCECSVFDAFQNPFIAWISSIGCLKALCTCRTGWCVGIVVCSRSRRCCWRDRVLRRGGVIGVRAVLLHLCRGSFFLDLASAPLETIRWCGKRWPWELLAASNVLHRKHMIFVTDVVP